MCLCERVYAGGAFVYACVQIQLTVTIPLSLERKTSQVFSLFHSNQLSCVA